MARKIEEFMAWRVYQYFFNALSEIRVARGYNTDPFVTMNYEEYRNASASHAVLIEVESHDAFEHAPGGDDGPRVGQGLVMVVMGSAQIEQGIPRKEAFKLEQDVRTAIHTGVRSLLSTIGRSAAFEFGDCPHDAGTLTPENEAGFRLSFRIGYPQGKTW